MSSRPLSSPPTLNVALRRALFLLPFLLVAGLLAAGCTPTPTGPAKAAQRAPTRIFAPPVQPNPNLEVLMINGGGNPQLNYQSHLLHLRHLRDLLLHSGVNAQRISILASDGADPAPDLSVRDVQPEEDFWRLQGTHLEGRLQTPTTLIDSTLEQAALEPATREHLEAWFKNAASRLKPDDTLLLYVTDHGTRNGNDPLDNMIMLWGNDAFISVKELQQLLGLLDPGVQVVSVMSQCYSGGFAGLAGVYDDKGLPAGNVCGFFSSTAERKAYGCFTQNLGKDNVGHSFELMRALERGSRTLEQAHQEVLVHDLTPDVPLRSSDVYLQNLVGRDASAKRTAFEVHVDALLNQAFSDAAKWENETRVLDAVAQAYGSFSPRSLAELRDLSTRLPQIEQQLSLVNRAWDDALRDANTSNLEAFVVGSPQWQQRLAQPELAKLDANRTRALTAQLLPALSQFTSRDADKAQRIETLHTRGEATDEADYRMQVRLAVVLRLRTLLIRIAGREYLETSGSEAERTAFDKLSSCESLSLNLGVPKADEEATAPAYPPFEDDVKLTQSALPGWIGISFKDPDTELARKQMLPKGASEVQVVYPNSPAERAGFKVGDIVLGPDGNYFTEKNQIRAWTMLADVGKPGELVVLRENQQQLLRIVPGPFPVKWPELPGPSELGSAAPEVKLLPFQGAVAKYTSPKTEHLLFFWATWCGPCKAALPELLDFEKERKVPVVAVTNEDAEVLKAFLRRFDKPFPKAIGIDAKRRSFIDYGVSGTPTFVLIDKNGKVAWRQVGYRPSQGLTIPGWTWSGRPQGQ